MTIVCKMAPWRADRKALHSELDIIERDEVTKQTTVLARVCAYSWCTGDCGFPAGVIVSPEGIEHKIYGSMVACGNLVQRWRVEWKGERFVIPPEHWAYLSTRIWF